MNTEPRTPFQDPREILKAHVASIVQGTASQLEKTALTYRISGGPPGKRLLTTLRVSGDGVAIREHSDEIRGKRSTRAKTTLSQNEVKSLFRQVQESGLLEQLETGTGFLPDSIVGSIIITLAGAQVGYHFLPEEHQQKSQRKEPTPPVQRLRMVLEDLSKKVQRESGSKKTAAKNKKQRR
jgi:hypothetical protein